MSSNELVMHQSRVTVTRDVDNRRKYERGTNFGVCGTNFPVSGTNLRVFGTNFGGNGTNANLRMLCDNQLQVRVRYECGTSRVRVACAEQDRLICQVDPSIRWDEAGVLSFG